MFGQYVYTYWYSVTPYPARLYPIQANHVTHLSMIQIRLHPHTVYATFIQVLTIPRKTKPTDLNMSGKIRDGLETAVYITTYI